MRETLARQLTNTGPLTRMPVHIQVNPFLLNPANFQKNSWLRTLPAIHSNYHYHNSGHNSPVVDDDGNLVAFSFGTYVPTIDKVANIHLVNRL